MFRNSKYFPVATVIMPVRQFFHVRVCKRLQRHNIFQSKISQLGPAQQWHFLPRKLLPNTGGLLPQQFTFSKVVIHLYAVGHILLSRLFLSRDIEPNPGPPKRDTIIFGCNLCKRDIKETSPASANVCANEDFRCAVSCKVWWLIKHKILKVQERSRFSREMVLPRSWLQ